MKHFFRNPASKKMFGIGLQSRIYLLYEFQKCNFVSLYYFLTGYYKLKQVAINYFRKPFRGHLKACLEYFVQNGENLLASTQKKWSQRK